MEVVNIAASLVLILIVAVQAWKIRKIHLASFEMRASLARIEKEVNAIYPQTQCYLELSALLDLKHGLPVLRGYAGSPDFLLVLANFVRESRPTTMLECSSGSSTIVLARMASLNGVGHVYSLEHDPVYAERTVEALRRNGLQDFASVITAPLVKTELTDEWNGLWYDLSALDLPAGSVDFLVVDGPPVNTGSLARYPAVPRMREYLSDSACVFLDDADREDEEEILRRWSGLPYVRSIERLRAEKGLAKIEYSEDASSS